MGTEDVRRGKERFRERDLVKVMISNLYYMYLSERAGGPGGLY